MQETHRCLNSPRNMLELLNVEDVEDQLGSYEPPTPLSCNSRLRFSETSLTLYCLVSSVSKSDVGQYLCRAENVAGARESPAITLGVHGEMISILF